MFTRAGFNARNRTVAHARVWAGNGRLRWAQLIMFVPSMELCWYVRGVMLKWAAKPANVILVPDIPGELHYWEWPRSRFPR